MASHIICPHCALIYMRFLRVIDANLVPFCFHLIIVHGMVATVTMSGIVNLSQNCYVSALLQCLACINPAVQLVNEHYNEHKRG